MQIVRKVVLGKLPETGVLERHANAVENVGGAVDQRPIQIEYQPPHVAVGKKRVQRQCVLHDLMLA